MRNRLTLLVLALLLAVALAGCSEQKSAADKEQEKQGQVYKSLTETQPARGMAYSPTRDNLNRWAETWEEQGKLSYVYLLDSVGHQIGYYIFEGLPVSYCATLTPPEEIHEDWGSSAVSTAVTTAPSLDGAYYGAANCQQMFGYDAVSGAYMEFTGGGSFNYLLSDQPMTRIDTKPLGDATIEQVEKEK
jgi:hypothetical protein